MRPLVLTAVLLFACNDGSDIDTVMDTGDDSDLGTDTDLGTDLDDDSDTDSDADTDDDTNPAGVPLADEDLGQNIGAPVVTATTCGDADDVTTTCGLAGGEDRVYAWSVPATGTYAFTVEEVNRFGMDPVMEVLLADGSSLGCNDDAPSTAPVSFPNSYLELSLTQGDDVLIVVDGRDEMPLCGEFTLSIEAE